MKTRIFLLIASFAATSVLTAQVRRPSPDLATEVQVAAMTEAMDLTPAEQAKVAAIVRDIQQERADMVVSGASQRRLVNLARKERRQIEEVVGLARYKAWKAQAKNMQNNPRLARPTGTEAVKTTGRHTSYAPQRRVVVVGTGGGANADRMVASRLANMTRAMNLTPEEQAKVGAILQKSREEMSRLMRSGDRNGARERMNAIPMDENRQIEAVVGAERYRMYQQKMQQNRGMRNGQGRQGGRGAARY